MSMCHHALRTEGMTKGSGVVACHTIFAYRSCGQDLPERQCAGCLRQGEAKGSGERAPEDAGVQIPFEIPIRPSCAAITGSMSVNDFPKWTRELKSDSTVCYWQKAILWFADLEGNVSTLCRGGPPDEVESQGSTKSSHTTLGHHARAAGQTPSPRRGGRLEWGASAGGVQPASSPPPSPSPVSGGGEPVC
jgi:hypothetical protein